MEPIYFAIICVVVIGVVIAVYFIASARRSNSGDALDRARRMQQVEAQGPPVEEASRSGRRESMPTVEKYISGAEFTRKLMDTLARAGWHIKPSEYVGIVIGAMGLGTIGATILTQSVPIGAIGGLVGYVVPRTMLNLAVGRRMSALENQVPDAILLISSAIKSGYSFLRALQVVAREMGPPISELCRKVVDECQLGVPMEDSLQRMADRSRSYDLGLVVTAVIIQSQVGGSLAEVLDSIAATVRERVQVQAEVSALTAEGRISGIVLIALSPIMAIALVFLNPIYMSVLISDPLGIKMIIGSVVLQLLGIFVIRRMMKIDL